MVKTLWRVVVFLTIWLGAAPHAGAVNYAGGAVANCALAANTYTCGSFAIADNDSAVIASGYTVIVNGAVSLAYAQGLTMSGSARLTTSGGNNIDLSGSNNLNISGGSIAAGGNFKLGSNPQKISASVSAASITINNGSTVTGNISASGVVNLNSGAIINGNVSGANVNTSGATVTVNGNLSATAVNGNGGVIDLDASTIISGNVQGAAISTGSATSIGGTLTVSGTANLGSGIKVSGAVSANAVSTGSPSQFGAGIVAKTTLELDSGANVTGDISGTVITTTSAVTIKGAVTASTSFNLASGSSVTGDISAPKVTLAASGSTVTGNITAATSLAIGSGNKVNGNVGDGVNGNGTLTLDSAGSVINGDVSFKGNIDIGAQTTINGNLKGYDVITHAENSFMNGNVAVNSLFLDWKATVSKIITCTGPGASGCSCVRQADPNYKPMCGAAPPTMPHHIQITHSGSALTCQAEPVTLTACADAACSSKVNADTSVTLQPGGGVFTISGGTNTGASVRQSTAGTATLSATGGLNASTCVNSVAGSTSCAMQFADSGLTLSAPDHIAMSEASVIVQAFKSSDDKKTCVPLVAGKTVAIDFSCAYNDPLAANAASVPLLLRDQGAAAAGATSVSCGGARTGVALAFDGNGKAIAKLQYAEVGNVGLKAAYSAAGLGASSADGVAFTAAPAGFKVEAKRNASSPALAAGVFARASEAFTLTISALNAAGQVSTNFGKEKAPESIAISVLVKDPASGAGALSAGAGGKSVANGVLQDSYTFSDTGVITVSAALARSSKNYMDNNSAGFATKGQLDIGRFIPDHFDTMLPVLSASPAAGELSSASVEGLTMGCASAGSGNLNPCQGTTRFLYALQPVFVVIKAYNGASPPALTRNYSTAAGGAANGALSTAPVTLSAWTAGGGAVAVPASVGAPKWADGSAGAQQLGFSGGVAMPAVRFDLAQPLTDPTAFYLRASDTEATSSLRAGAVEQGLTVVSGRMLVPNNYGSYGAPLPLTIQAQYYASGRGGYVFNPAYYASARDIGAYLSYSNCQNGLDTSSDKKGHVCGAAASLATAPGASQLLFQKGRAALRLMPPTPAPASNGSVDLQLKSPSTATPANAPVIPWLPSSVGRQTFGIYRSGPVIYTREIY